MIQKIIKGLVLGMLVFSQSTNAQLFQGTIKPGALATQVDIYVKPDFNFTSSYIYQYQFPIAFPASASPQPTGITFTKDATFTSVEESGATYSVSIYPKAHNTAGTVNYFVVSMIRTGSTNYSRSANTEYKVGTVTFVSGALPPATAQVKLADFQDGGSDGQGNFYAQSGATYYVTSTSNGNFYSSAGVSTVGGDASEGFVSTDAPIALPVKLISFAGVADNCNAALNWSTNDETNFNHFEVEQSADGVHFTKVANVAPAGNITGGTYRYTSSQSQTLAYYRLKMIDNNNEVEYSNIVKVRQNCVVSDRSAVVTPNPARATQGFNVNVLGYKGSIYGSLYNNLGAFVTKVKLANGVNHIDAAELAAGVYQLSIADSDGNTSTQKIIITR